MGLNEVFKKVSAINEVTELSSERIELASIQELEKAIKDSNIQSDLYAKLIKDIDAYDKERQAKKEMMLKKAEDFRRELNNKKNALGNTWEDFTKKAKELGIDAKNIPQWKIADTAYMKLVQESKELTDLITKKFGGKF